MAGQYVKVYLDDTELRALGYWKWLQAARGEKDATNHIMKEALKAFLLGHGIYELKPGVIGQRLVVKTAEELGVQTEKVGSLAHEPVEKSTNTKVGTNGVRRQGTRSERVRRGAGDDPAGAPSAQFSRAGEAGTAAQSGGRDGQRRRRTGARAARRAE